MSTSSVVSALVTVTVSPSVSGHVSVTAERDLPSDPVTTESDTGTLTVEDDFPPDVDPYCILSGTVKDVMDRPVRGAAFRFVAISEATIAPHEKIAHTDRNGVFTIRLLCKLKIIASCDAMKYRKIITIPDKAEADIKDL